MFDFCLRAISIAIAFADRVVDDCLFAEAGQGKHAGRQTDKMADIVESIRSKLSKLFMEYQPMLESDDEFVGLW